MRLLFLLPIFFTAVTEAATLQLTGEQFITSYNKQIEKLELSDKENLLLTNGDFEVIGPRSVARISAADNSMIILTDADGDDLLDAVGVLYSAIGNEEQLDENIVAVKSSLIKAIIGEKSFNSDRLKIIKDHQAVRFNNSSLVKVKGYNVVAAQQSPGSQLIAIVRP